MPSEDTGPPKRPSSRPRAGDPAADLRRRTKRLQRDLSQVLFDLLARKEAAGLVPKAPDRFALRLELELFAAGPLEATPDQLNEQIQRAVDRWVDRTAAFPYGHVYCAWCQSFTCEHSTPSQPREIFGGYSATGQPLWTELGARLLQKRDPRVEQIYTQSAPPVTLVESGAELTEKQLSIYGKNNSAYRLLAQVTVGYVPLRYGTGKERVALTFQAAELAGGGRIALNVLGTLSDGSTAFAKLEEAADSRIQDGIRATRLALSDLQLRRFPRRRRAMEKRRRALMILRRLARQLDRVFRQGGRRTLHSQKRHQDRSRPTASAFRDALEASEDAFFRDVEENTWVLLGPKGRVHVFNDSGQHVTSVVYSGDTVRGRTTRGKWLTPRPVDLQRFRKALRRRKSES